MYDILYVYMYMHSGGTRTKMGLVLCLTPSLSLSLTLSHARTRTRTHILSPYLSLSLSLSLFTAGRWLAGCLEAAHTPTHGYEAAARLAIFPRSLVIFLLLPDLLIHNDVTNI